ncbi:MAG: hypothetical protein A3J55_04220 [Candidatus Ryanbacteria bacterium RIFCSPHIGHO2_02_FULL_45_17b]|uniref:Hydrolase TatD n=1 Tax=Candidatus Ryanbacteria bacterium RIFCSPHIGHO2_01_FULL_45_22 TaxID=1802114 RepID=A0A1G2G2P0_9BACT|nr:MAG: hypothetical protein A2719_02355 [Candidatus Ryanbacteria bacterium RIFCSPHIGHO2_01_FULL_45_22]OGZ46478.1 MAG: hypothetical protein A3J55_04220 [Candidatus Ryanbacteria bacterium RIFCSPHIGHO2_02_FULL_45_17b]
MSIPKLIDIHTHVNFNAFKDDGDEVVKRTLENNIWMILVGSQIDTSRRAVEYAEKYPEGVYAAVGLHPIHLTEAYVDAKEISEEGVLGFKTRVESFSYEVYKELAQHLKTVAIGECGLDYYRTTEHGTHNMEQIKKLQADTFRQQIALAREVKKPLMIHCRNAYEDLIQILKEEHAQEIGGDIHFFAGSWDVAKQFLDLGFYLSFTGVVTFARDYDEVLKNVPMDRVMIETDAPYVTPVPHRGKRNEPLYVEYVAQKIAEIKNLPETEVFEQLVGNTRKLFRL